MKFDVVIGNPPYQDGTKEGGQNKIYNQFCKKALTLVKNDGILAFVTPTSVLKKSERFSLRGQKGLARVDFTANEYFSVGINICYWIINKAFDGSEVVVKNQLSEGLQSASAGIYDYSKVTPEFSRLYEALKDATNKPALRMFSHNSIDMSIRRSPVKTEKHIYSMYKLNSDNTQRFIQYNSVRPKLFGKQKIIVAITKSFNENAMIIDTNDYDMAHVETEVDSISTAENIKSFIFSDYFKNHVQKWKGVDGYGYNYAVMYLPKFDKTKSWTNEEVKAFLESFADVK